MLPRLESGKNLLARNGMTMPGSTTHLKKNKKIKFRNDHYGVQHTRKSESMESVNDMCDGKKLNTLSNSSLRKKKNQRNPYQHHSHMSEVFLRSKYGFPSPNKYQWNDVYENSYVHNQNEKTI